MGTGVNLPDHPAALTAREIVRALVAAGVDEVVLAPGSRSAPLAYALHSAEAAGWLNMTVCVDERSAAFVAVGIARHRPVAVVTTSGTAVANLHPAVLEASHAGLPLVVLSADRPHELRGVGANQTTNQVGIFATAVRWQGEVPAADTATSAVVGVNVAVLRAVTAARGSRSAHPGPVHLNVAFRDPLVPAAVWEPEDRPVDQVVSTGDGTEVMPTLLPRGPRTVIVAGDGAGAAAVELARAGGWPVLAEPTSGARSAAQAVAAPAVLAEILGDEVQRVVVLGRPTLSRQVSALLARREVEIVVAAPGPDWVDVAGSAALVTRAVTVLDEPGASEVAWLDRWLRASDQAHQVLESLAAERLGGPQVARALLGPRNTAGTVVLGSSMSVRDADLAAGVGAGFTRVPVLANRGLSGIDGTISTATGVAVATGEPVRALIGDLSFQHDVGGLARGRLEREVNAQVIVLNDDGGSIFATLEHGRPELAEIYPRVFGTPQGLDIEALARGFGAAYRSVEDAGELVAVLAEPVRGRSVVEVRLDGAAARERALDLQARIRDHVVGAGDG
ncbi:2-succinyl-5-enolpyruvyl-6-hydroxy-3-cyclohexene-1-carboxylic-acid synthase [Pseudactinotalea sp. Z1732]|uniref:2-succinyl-5-enolpyruvyl-6-hydroxy-3- cyclohexene-1-carboxylic-acid synthase n=1 Tax=Micrococcales TaxID=85006 RepID=UPI003C7A1C93